MSSSPSGIYHSKVLSSILRQTRRWRDRGSVAVRRVQVAASWSAQILLYPIYALFQTSRVIGAQVYQTVQLGIPGLRSTATSTPASTAVDFPSDPATSPITVDTPIATVLQTIQELALPIGIPVLLEGVDAIAPISPLVAPTQHSSSELVTDGIGIAIPGVSVFIRGIATLLDTGAIVLVTNQNQILDILTPEQQARLQYRVTWEVASYGRVLNLRKTVANLPLPQFNVELNTNTSAPSGVNRIAQGLSALAHRVFQAVEHIGNEAYRIGRSGLFGRSLAAYDSPLIPGVSLLTATVDTPLERALQAVKQFPLPMHLLASCLEPALGQLEPAATNAESGNHLTRSALSQAALTPVLTIPPELATLPALYVRGVASLLDTRAIVLVTNQNQTLNLLSPEQQTQIRQRVIWAVAHFYRYQQIRRSVSRSFSPVRLPAQQVLLPIRGFYQLMAWVQSGSVAIATNLFQEAKLAARRAWAAERSLLDVQLPDWSYPHPVVSVNSPLPSAASTAPRRLTPSWLEAVNQRYHSWLNSQAVQAVIARVRTQVTALLPPARTQVAPSPVVNRPDTNPSQLVDQPLTDTGLEFGSTARQSLLSWQESTLVLANSAADIWDSYAPPPEVSSPVATTSPTTTRHSATDQITSTTPDYIEIQATLIGYLHSPLEWLLRWLDRGLLWVENIVMWVWRWWQQACNRSSK